MTIRDDGPGIGTQEEKPSTGLGMELCQAIAAAHTKGEQRGSATLENHPGGAPSSRSGYLESICHPFLRHTTNA